MATASVHALPRPTSGGRPPLVPAKGEVHDAPDFRLPISLLDSEWYPSCPRVEALAGTNLQARATHQQGGSLPSSDPRLADFGRDVEGWLAAKDKALAGWTLCSDHRHHHPEVARNVLHIWIGRLERRRASAFGNAMVYAGPGDVVVNLGGVGNVVTGRDGNEIMSNSAGATAVTLGDGNDAVTATAGRCWRWAQRGRSTSPVRRKASSIRVMSGWAEAISAL